MMNQDTCDKMKRMKLYGMHNAFETILANPQADKLTADQLVAQLIDAESDDRYNRKISRLLKNAHLRYKALMEEIDYDEPRGLDRTLLNRLAECRYIDEAEHIILTGSTGVGKSHIACALGVQACYREYKVLYFNTSRLLAQLRMAKAEGTYLKLMQRIKTHSLLILDDFGLQPIDNQNSHILLEIVEDRYQIGSVIFTAQIPVEAWYEIIADKTLADAIMDRIVHRAHRIQLTGESMRKKLKKETK